MKKLRFGTFLAPNMLPVYQAITEVVGKELGMATELVVETDYENCAKDINDVCFVCSLPYIEYERQGRAQAIPIAAPVLKGARYHGKPIYFSDVIVRKDSSLKSFKDLRGHSWSYNEPLSQSGYGITRYTMVKMGETHGFFSKVINAGYHEESIRLVLDGKIDASAIDSQVLSVAMRDDSLLRRGLKIIDTLGPSTIQPIAVSKRLSETLRQQILQILLDFHKGSKNRKKLDLGLVDHFVAIGPKDYDDIRMMLDACEKANFMVIK
ncbi:MAG TPA: PhnD/SsuA/transferrin family substrate-binding protein [Candidatus Saccharimonadales bacterium]|nr:PhnD/SsuA/transferrin family substrate-binding protein [Candidatus Saccharimonadales bacterium]